MRSHAVYPEKDSPPPAVSVVVVSDYAGGQARSWNGLRAVLAALARQDFEEPAEFLLSECSALAGEIPADLAELLPSLRIVLSPASSSYELKNEGVRRASAGIVALIDADCVPDRAWLRRLVEALRRQPDAAAVSGRTVYAGRSLTERVLALLSRSYLDPGRAGATRFISNNNAGFRRSVLRMHPLPVDAGPFAARLQSQAVLRGGGRLLFEPGMRVVHEFEGWPLEADIRRNLGYSAVLTRLRDGSLPHAWLTRLGYASIPLFFGGKIVDSFWNCIRCAPLYGVRRFELAAAFAFAVVVHAMEIPGMVAAFRGRKLAATGYR